MRNRSYNILLWWRSLTVINRLSRCYQTWNSPRNLGWQRFLVKNPWNCHLSHVLCVQKWKCHKVEYSKLSLIWLMIWHMTWRLGQAALNYKIINLPNIKTYKYTHLTKCLLSAFCFHNYSVKPSIKFLFTKYRVNKFINQWQTHRFTWTSITFHSNILLLEHEGY